MPQRVYIETTEISYLTARPSRDVVIAGHQQSTHDWWNYRRHHYSPCASQLVVQEASAGDQQAARDRLEVLAPITLLAISGPAVSLAERLLEGQALPPKAADDALHIAIAAVNDVPYLLTWNCRHMANASLRKQIEKICAETGHNAPTICTLEELLGDIDDPQ